VLEQTFAREKNDWTAADRSAYIIITTTPTKSTTKNK